MKPAQPARPVKARNRGPRRKTVSYAAPIKMRAAFLAGMGMSGGQIAADIGVSDPQKVRAMLRANGIKLLRGAGAIDVLIVRIPREVAAAVTSLADKADMLTEDFAARVITTMTVEEPVLLMNLIADEDAE